MVMLVGFDNLYFLGQFLCPALCDISHRRSLKEFRILSTFNPNSCHEAFSIRKMFRQVDKILQQKQKTQLRMTAGTNMIFKYK
jgi:hypothetical protein